jgi:hypothetical protein
MFSLADGSAVFEAYTLTRNPKSPEKTENESEKAPTYSTIIEDPPTIEELKQDKEFKKLNKTAERETSNLEKKIAKVTLNFLYINCWIICYCILYYHCFANPKFLDYYPIPNLETTENYHFGFLTHMI